MLHTCQIGRMLARCRHQAVATCQYCGREFCAAHGERHQGGEEVCVRPVCREKHADLLAHLAWREQATERGNRGFCGMADCDNSRWGQCSKCHALFCEAHLHDRDERVRHGSVVFGRPVSMCDHCLARNKLWARL